MSNRLKENEKSVHLTRLIKIFSVFILSFLLIFPSVSFADTLDLSTLFSNGYNASFSGTDTTLTVNQTNKTYTAFVTRSSSYGSLSCSFSRTRSDTEEKLIQTGGTYTFTNYGDLVVKNNSIYAPAGVSSGSFELVYSGASSLQIFAGAGSVSFGSSAGCTYTFTNLSLDGITYVGGPLVMSTLDLANGYLAVFDVGSSTDYDFYMTSYSERLNNILSGSFTYANTLFWFADSLPTEDTQVPPTVQTANMVVPWQPIEPKTITGQSHYMGATLSGTSTGRYLYLFNPAIHVISTSANGYGQQVENEHINVFLPEGLTLYVYDTADELSLVGGGIVGSVVGTDYGTATTTASGGSIILLSGSDPSVTYIMNSGGSTDVSGLGFQSTGSYLSQLKSTLDSFEDKLLSLLTAPISHIQSLIQAGSSFFTVFSQLFEWLPSEVSAVLTSALVLMVVIGLIKMLL